MPKFFRRKKPETKPKIRQITEEDRQRRAAILEALEKNREATKNSMNQKALLKEIVSALKFLGIPQTRENISHYSKLVSLMPDETFEKFMKILKSSTGNAIFGAIHNQDGSIAHQYIVIPLRFFKNKKKFRLYLRHEIEHAIKQEQFNPALEEVVTYAFGEFEHMLAPNWKEYFQKRLHDFDNPDLGLFYQPAARIGLNAAKTAAELHRTYGKNVAKKFLEKIRAKPPYSMKKLRQLKEEIIRERIAEIRRAKGKSN